MSIKTEIERIEANVAAAYTALSAKGGTLPLTQTSANLASAIDSIPAGADGKAAARDGWSNRNLLDNWYFVNPINQRGKTEFVGNGYSIDRWLIAGDSTLKLEVKGTGIVFTKASQVNAFFVQKLEPVLVSSLRNKEITLSILTNSSLFSGTVVFTESEGMVVDMGNSTYFRMRNSDGEISILFSNTSSNLTVIAAKLELGPVQTLARKEGDTWVLNDPPPNKALELAKCNRYFVRVAPGLVANYNSMPLGLAFIGGTEFVNFLGIVPVPLRALPTVTYSGLVLRDMTEGTSISLPNDGIATTPDCSAGNIHVNIRFPDMTFNAAHIYRIAITAGGFLNFDSNL